MTAYDEYGMPVGAYAGSESYPLYAWRAARATWTYRAKPVVQRTINGYRRGEWSFRGMITSVKVLVVLWWVLLYWGERTVFKEAIASCQWDYWEDWEPGANPHRLIFIADPQLVDPHTYPGRPWPLNTLTVKHTDLYIRRSYSRIQRVLYPDSVVMLGDLFDGGREWSTRTTTSPEEQYRKFGNNFWLQEYSRFGNIFFKHWADGGLDPRPGQPGRKIISSLPGNHDLGFGKGIQEGVRRRFNAYFGDGNRIDILANHTFVSLDSVSLSAQLQEGASQELWAPGMEFLDTAKVQKRRLVQRELRKQQGLSPYPGFSHDIVEAGDLATAQLPHSDQDVTEFPTILLSHVPLYRKPGTPCGPLRERWPPTPPPKGQTERLEPDDRNAISVSSGYQYQNVLTKQLTRDIAEKIGDIAHAFSGDDHDYCEVVHRGYASAGGGIREITVKSISWAMGVRHPGVVMASLWNPVNERGAPLTETAGKATLQTHLCLLPDQLGIFIRYVELVALTFFVLLVRAMLVAAGRIQSTWASTEPSLLPMTNSSSAENEKAGEVSRYHNEDGYNNQSHSSNSSTASERGNGNLQVRSAQARTRSVSPNTTHNSYALPQSQSNYTYPLIQHAGYYSYPDAEAEKEREKRAARVWGSATSTKPSSKKKKKGLALFLQEVRNSVGTVALCAFGWYFWLVWKG